MWVMAGGTHHCVQELTWNCVWGVHAQVTCLWIMKQISDNILENNNGKLTFDVECARPLHCGKQDRLSFICIQTLNIWFPSS